MALPALAALGSLAAKASIRLISRYILRHGPKETAEKLAKALPSRSSRNITKAIKAAEKEIDTAKKLYDKAKKGNVTTTGKYSQKSSTLGTTPTQLKGNVVPKTTPKTKEGKILRAYSETKGGKGKLAEGTGKYVRKDRVGQKTISTIGGRSNKNYTLKNKAGSPTTSFLKKEKGRMEKIKDRVEATLKKNKLKATGLTTAALIGVAATIDTDKPKKKTTTAKKQTTRKNTRPKPNPKNLENYMGGAGGIRVRKKRKK